jgi:hypothetical protein
LVGSTMGGYRQEHNRDQKEMVPSNHRLFRLDS